MCHRSWIVALALVVLAPVVGLILIGLEDLPAAARDQGQVRHFRYNHACPATGKTSGSCPGFVVDHIVPLCAGGADDPSNMQWQELAESREKDKAEWALCRWIRKELARGGGGK